MQNDFILSLKNVRQDEGGNDDDPRDHGGRTSRGITQREWNAYCHLENKPTCDVWQASDEDIDNVYKTQYWDPYCDDLPVGVDYLFFDMNVNAGLRQAVKILQKALGVTVDGMLGQVTLSATKSADTLKLIEAISENRRNFYRHLKQFNVYGRGWLNRVDHSEIAAKAMYAGTPHDKPATVTPKATEPDHPYVSPEATGTATGGLMAILAGFKDQLQSLSDAIPNLKYVILGIAVIGLGYTIYGMYRNNKIAQVF